MGVDVTFYVAGFDNRRQLETKVSEFETYLREDKDSRFYSANTQNGFNVVKVVSFARYSDAQRKLIETQVKTLKSYFPGNDIYLFSDLDDFEYVLDEIMNPTAYTNKRRVS